MHIKFEFNLNNNFDQVRFSAAYNKYIYTMMNMSLSMSITLSIMKTLNLNASRHYGGRYSVPKTTKATYLFKRTEKSMNCSA